MIPRASCDEIAGIRDEAVLVRVTAPPVEGAANAAVVNILSKRLNLPRRSLSVQTGTRSRSKLVHVAGVSVTDVATRLADAIAPPSRAVER